MVPSFPDCMILAVWGQGEVVATMIDRETVCCGSEEDHIEEVVDMFGE